jgi:hypothetical protein
MRLCFSEAFLYIFITKATLAGSHDEKQKQGLSLALRFSRQA